MAQLGQLVGVGTVSFAEAPGFPIRRVSDPLRGAAADQRIRNGPMAQTFTHLQVSK